MRAGRWRSTVDDECGCGWARRSIKWTARWLWSPPSSKATISTCAIAGWTCCAARVALGSGGLYRVLRVFRSQTDGLTFEVGQLIDGSLIGSGMAHRLQQGTRYIEPASLSLAA